MPCSITAAAVWKLTSSGISTSCAAGIRISSAYDPRNIANATRSPGANSVTSEPTRATTPAPSLPSAIGRVRFVETLPEVDVDEVHAARGERDDDVARAGRWRGAVDERQLLGTTRFEGNDAFHSYSHCGTFTR